MESPASVLKELLENSIDAKSNDIQIFIRSDGFESIQVRDNGVGILKDDLPLALESFATSKLNKIDDLISIKSFGFRGEALGAISSVANVTIESKYLESEYAYSIYKESNLISEINVSPLTEGTKVIVSDIFYDLPVRKEFTKNLRKVKKSMIDIATSFALAYPEISFKLYYHDKLLLNTQRVDKLSKRIEQLFSLEFFDSLLPSYQKTSAISVEGYISNFRFFKSSSDLILLFVNRRLVRYSKLISILKQVYGEMLIPGKFPVAFLFLDIPPEKIDVNVHPQKREIRFKDDSEIYLLLRKAILNALESQGSLHAKNLPRKKISYKEYPTDFSIPFKVQESVGIDTNIKFDQIRALSLIPSDKDSDIQPSKNTKLFSEFKLHGKLYNTFIMASAEEGIYLFDQHTVHERVNYEMFLDRLRKNKDIRQYLVSPIPIRLSLSETELMKNHREIIDQLGFTIEEIGPASFGLSSVPFYIGSGQEEEALQLLLKKLETKNENISLDPLEYEAIFKDMAASLACRQAIKKGDSESLNYLKELLERLQECENPLRCPHGRPTMVFIGKEEISMLFKRFH